MSRYPYEIPEPRLEPPEVEMPRCPICGAEAGCFYENDLGELVGCDECLRPVGARFLFRGPDWGC